MGLNRVYKVIWNKTKGCYVVVSELAKRVGRNKAKAIVMATAAMAMVVTPAVMNVNQVEATVLIGSTNGTTISDNGSTVSDWGITIGGGITNAGQHSVHVGDATLEEGNRNVIIGTHATAGVDKIAGRHFVNQSVAIGGGSEPNLGARAFGDQSIAIGSNTIAEGNSSIAIGNDDVDKAVGKQITYTNPDGKEETNTLGNAYNKLTGKDLLYDGGQYADTRSGEAAIAIGVKAEAKDISVALGTGAKAKVVNAVAIGTGAEATLDNSVAIGGGALVDKDSQGTKQTSTSINGITYNWAGGGKTNPGDVVSFGKPDFERQLKNVAAGAISVTSTDAINGSQIHSIVEKITGIPHFSYAGDDASTENVTAGSADEMTRDAEGKKQVVRSVQHGRLNLLGGADKTKLSDNNIGVTYTNGNTLTFKLAKELTGLTSAEFKDANNNVVNITPTGVSVAKPGATADTTVTLGQNGLNNGGNAITNVASGLENLTEAGKTELRDLTKPAVTDTTAATVGDLRNMGWVVSSNKTTGADGTATDAAYSATVKNANEVKFVGKDGAIVSGTTDAATGVRTITVGLDKKAMSGAGDSGSPVAYTKADGTKVYPVKAENGSVTYHTTPNGEGPNDAVVPGTEVITSVNGPDGTTTPATLTNVAGNLVGAKKDTNAPTTEQAAPTVGKGANEVNPNNAATVGDVLNAGWNLQENGTAKDFVKPYDKVNFVNGGNTTAVVTTNAEGTVSKVSFNVTGLPVSYTTEDGKPVSKVGDKFYKVNENGQPISEAGKPAVKTNDAGKLVDEDGTEIEPINPATTPLKNTLVNPNPAADKTGTTSPTQLTNVEGNLVGAKTGTDTPTTEQAAPTLGTAADQVNVHNVATVGDVLNAGWNLQENGTAKDFVKPYDKVNFVNGGNTTAVVTTNAEGTVSKVSFNVTGLPVSYTTEDGKPVSKVGDKFYKVNENGQPISEAGKPAVKTNDAGKLVDEDGTEIEPINPATTPLKNALVNPTPAADKTGTTTPTALNNVTSGLHKYGDTVNNAPVPGSTPANNGLVDLSVPKDGQPTVSDNTAATVGDLRNMGWIVSSDKTTGGTTEYSATVKNAEEVKFVGTGMAVVSGKTDDKTGVRTITVDVDNQVGTNKSVTPVEYTKKDGKKVYPKEVQEGGKTVVKFYENPEGTGTEVPNTEVITSVNGPEGTTTPTTLSNVKGNLPTVNDADKTAHDVDGAPIADKNNTAAPITAKDAADLLTPMKDGTPNPKFVGNNAATVSDVLNAGWNLQNNGTAKDFVKPYDTVNFINGGNTTAVVTTNAEGTVSNVSFNVTGLPVSYTTEDGKPVSKVGDKFYKVNEQGQPVSEAGKPAVKTNDAGKLVDEDGTEIEPINPATTPLKNTLVNPTPAADKTGTTSPTALNNVTSGLNKYGDQVNGKPVEGTTPANTGLIDLSTPADGAAPTVSDNTAATVGDLRNMGWIVSSNKTTGDLEHAYSATVKNANEVKFVGTGTAIVSGETKDGVRTITVNVDDQVSANNATTPVVYTKADGTKVYPIKGENGVITYHTTPDGKGDNDQEVPGTEVITSVNSPDGTTTPATLANVAGNLDGAKKDTTAPKAEAAAPNTTNKDGDKYINPNNAATVGDVLQAGWNLQNNGEAKDFVKPFDKVNFVNGGNTTAVVTTNAEGTVSNVSFNVTGLPVTYTTPDGKPVSKVGDKFYKVNEQGQPISEAGKPAVGTNAEGKLVDADNNVIEPIDPAATPLKTALVNANPEADKTGTTSPTALNNVTSGLHKYGDQVEGKPVEGTTPANTGLIDLSTPADGAAPKVSDNTAATVGDLRNMGWIVSSNKTTGDLEHAYSATVKNANEVKFVGTGTAIVSGETKDGVRTITVNVDDQVSANNAQTPVVYTDKEGKQVYPIKDEQGNITYHTTPNGKGEGDKTVPNDEVNTSVNGPKDPTTGEVRPASLSNVKNNLPAVNDGDKKVTNADGTEKENPGDAGNINKAPLTAAEAADLLNPTKKDGKANPNFAGNNAATVSDVLNAGWNLQNNGTAKDFVKPFDTVNFVNGGNTTAVVTTKADGTTSDVTFNVTGLPIATTITDPTTGKQVPVVKVGDTFYPANPDGTPNIARNDKGEPTNGYVRANDGKLYPREAVTVTPAADPTMPPTVTPNADAKPTTVNTNLANPNVDNTTNEPGNNVNTPTQLGNVANGADTFKPANDVKQANDGKWYNATDVEPNGKVKDGAKPVASPLATKNAAGDVLERGNDGNWYKASDLENGEPKPNVDEQTPVAKPANTEKAGLVNFENSNPNNAATVGDLQNLGFVVAAQDNGYTEQMRNANKVEFKGSNGVSVTGKTLEDGTREITVALKEGRVTNDVIITNADGTETHGVRGEDGKIYAKDPKTGKATKTEIQVAPTDTVTNDGNAYVTGNSVATAIQKSGWNIGIGSTTKEFSTEEKTYEKVNPSDKVKYVNGDNTTVSMAVDEAKDRDGTKVTTTYVKVDVKRDLKIDSLTTGGPAKDTDGNSLQAINGEYYPANAVEKDGKVYPAGTVFIDGKAYPAGSAKDPNTNEVVKNGQPAAEVQPLTATPKDKVADGKDGAMTVKDAKGNDGVSATAKDGKGTLTLNNAKAGKDGKDAASVAISTDKAPADLDNTPKDAVRANDGKWYAPADVDVKTENGTTVVTPKAGKSPMADAPTMDRIQYKGTDGKLRDVATMDDGLRFQGDDGESISKPLNSTVQLTGGNREDTGKPVAKDATTTGNIGVFNTDGKLSIQLAKDLDKLNSANFESKTDKAGNPLKAVDGKYYPENSVVQEGKVYPEGTVIIDNKPYPAGTTKDAAGNVVNNGKPATEATPINPIDSKQVQEGPTSKLTGTGLTFNTPTPKDEKGNPLVLVDGKYYKADNLENGKPKAGAKPEPVKPAQATAFTPDGLVVTPDTAKVVDPKTGEVKVDPNKVVSFGAPSIVTDPATGKPVIDPKTGEPVMKSGISAGGQVMSNVAPGVLDTDAVNVSQLKGVANNINMRMDRMGAQAAAMAGLRHLQYDPLEPTTIMAGVGTYKGEGALALGIAHYKNESTLFHMGASIGSRGDELMANAGVSWKFGARADETAVKDTFRQGPISASYTLQDKVSALEEQNQVLKEQVAELFRRLNEKA